MWCSFTYCKYSQSLNANCRFDNVTSGMQYIVGRTFITGPMIILWRFQLFEHCYAVSSIGTLTPLLQSGGNGSGTVPAESGIFELAQYWVWHSRVINGKTTWKCTEIETVLSTVHIRCVEYVLSPYYTTYLLPLSLLPVFLLLYLSWHFVEPFTGNSLLILRI